ncbi:MAG: LacI family DNA-binding transcriptional regulator [Lentisphaerae bacterium]|jgi:LacI family transcriptional regulator|nr:LacI family DNA-binding transcriptional regulator [Lentisphaerota bacterium]MBT5612333.1 LacI family DNA-binding transcriptional regulator [Lentisphaerota bacterium]MBT7056637.1 LacI family DNA-binding transcriptional regulator [Lentisphaerota bacterium]MBT7840562.1 LacI family DNA-binding transcriptional regulator [Lentisphaerota bacterium]
MPRKKRNRPNIYDIATEAGVSISMVSRVVNGSGPVAEAKRKHVMAVLKRHDYQPSAAARSLARRDTNVIGLVIGASGAEYTQLFANRVLEGISACCRQVNRNVLLLWADRETDPAELIQDVGASVDGLILLDMRYDPGLTAALKEAGLSAVLVNEPSPCGDEASVLMDNRQGGRLAADYLISCGHRRIGLITGDLRLHIGRDRYEGAVAALNEAGLPCRTDWVTDARFRPKTARQAVRELFANPAGERPTALFVASDLMAFAVLDELRSLGLNVPGDVSVVGFDNSLIAPLASPPLTTIQQPLVAMGKRAAELLDEVIRDPEAKQTVTLPLSLCERRSVRQLDS